MSGTKRIPIARRRAPAISPTAVAIFGEMMHCACDCPDDFDFACDQRCPGCQRYRELELHLHHELKLKPWEEIADPNAEYYPPGWSPPEDAFARWRALEEGLRERRANG